MATTIRHLGLGVLVVSMFGSACRESSQASARQDAAEGGSEGDGGTTSGGRTSILDLGRSGEEDGGASTHSAGTSGSTSEVASGGTTGVDATAGTAGWFCILEGESCENDPCCEGECIGNLCTSGGGGTAGTSSADAGSAGSASYGGDVNMDGCNANLLDGDLGEDGNVVGGDPERTDDNPCGVEGRFYTYGDGSSCTVPADGLPCVDGVCTIAGTTLVDDLLVPWGCGIGLSLNDPDNDISTKSHYAGSANGFRITIVGEFNQELRVSYTTTSILTGLISPFVGGSSGTSTIPGPGTYTVLFSDVSCPPSTWGDCDELYDYPYDLHIQIVGGVGDGEFSLSLTEVTPVAE